MLETCKAQQKLVIRLKGRLDTAKCAEIEPEIRAAVAGADTAVVFDLDGVDFICSAFLRLCINAQRQAAGRGFQVVNPEPCVKRVFKISGLDAMLEGQ